MAFIVKECSDTEAIIPLFVEYSHIKGAESCFVSFDKELADLVVAVGTVVVVIKERMAEKKKQ